MTTVSYTPDPNQKPQLTEEQEGKLAELKDEDLDYSDIPELDDDFWKNAQPVMPDLTKPVTLRVKQSVLQYFQANGKKGYQSRMNAVLESYVKAQQTNNNG
ncbi:MAG: BrnA antitoxin family protein [Cyanobacteria bacterium J06621_12]